MNFDSLNMFASYWRMLLHVAIISANCYAQEDILRNALMAINHRPRDTIAEPELYDSNFYLQETPAHYRHYLPSDEPNYAQQESDEPINELPYAVEYTDRLPDAAMGKILFDYLGENNRETPNEGINKRMLSSFRERMEGEKSQENHDKLTEMFLQKLQENSDDSEPTAEGDNTEYMNMIDNLWQKYMKYQQHHDEPIYAEEIRKRQIPADYSTLGWSGVGYKKRSYEPDDNNLYFLQYEPKDEVNYDRRYKMNPEQQEYVYAKRKRFPVAKRSSNFYGTSGRYHKRDRVNRRADSASGTDPKVMKDLTNIFVSKNLKKVNLTNSKKLYEKKNKKASVIVTSEASVTKPSLVDSKHPQQKKNSWDKTDHEEPLNIKKKSIDWSNYFGIDRRKKNVLHTNNNNNNNKIDNDWLVKRYNQAVKRSSEFPLNIFRNHDTSEPKTNEIEKKNTQTKNPDDLKIGDMDMKLENIEDLIIDEALKYTGAHESDTDPKEVQQVKDKVISRLAAAYSLEKMRRALSEFKTSLAAQRYALKAKENQNNDPAESSVAVKKVSPLRAEQIKCTSKDCGIGDDYPNVELSRNHLANEGYTRNLQNLAGDIGGEETCPLIERRCQSIIARENAAIFHSLCKWHQMCYLCSPDNNPVQLTSCDIMFLSKTDLVCERDVVCQWAGRSAVAHLRDMHESATMELAGQCDRNVCDSDMYTEQASIHLQRR